MPHPLPSKNIIDLPAINFPQGSKFFRIHNSSYSSLYFGKAKIYRFDDPKQDFGICYTSEKFEGAILETFGHSTGNKIFDRADINQRICSYVITDKNLKLVDITGKNLTKIGADSRLFSTTDYNIPQSWSRYFWEHADNFDGIYYHLRHNPDIKGIALYDRTSGHIQEKCFINNLCLSQRFTNICSKYKYIII